MWGRIYEEAKQISMQSYIRFLRKEVSDDFKISIRGRGFVGRLPAEAVALAPRRISVNDVGAIQRDFENRAVVRREPNAESPGRLIPLDLSTGQSYSYYVREVRGDWMHIAAEGSGPSGWVRAGSEENWPSTVKLGKLDLVEAVVGYLQYRALQDGTAKNVSKRTAEWAERALARFEDSGVEQSPMARALGETLRAYFGVFGPSASAEKALEHLREAVGLVPYSADVRNLELLVRLHLAYQGRMRGLKPSDIEKDYVRAVALEPENPRVVANLENFYQLLSSVGPPPESVSDPILTGAELQRRLLVLQAVREKKPFPWDDKQAPGSVQGSIMATLRDSSGAAVPGVTVTLMNLETGKVWVVGPSDSDGLAGASQIQSGMIRMGDPNFVLLSPSRTNIATLQPRFRWVPMNNADTYVVKLLDRQERVLWRQGVFSTEVQYPAGAQPLAWGKRYWWRVTAREGGDMLAEAGSFFQVLPSERAEQIRATEDSLRQLLQDNPSDNAPRFLLAFLYEENGMVVEAARVYGELADRMGPQSWVRGRLTQLLNKLGWVRVASGALR